jgi:hypothetical protein
MVQVNKFGPFYFGNSFTSSFRPLVHSKQGDQMRQIFAYIHIVQLATLDIEEVANKIGLLSSKEKIMY